MGTHIFGVRHHGPGCARSLRAALEALCPDVVLVEGPPDAEPIVPLLLDERMRPPVAMLIYVPEKPQRAAFYPFALFSPEWQALRYGLERAIPVRFMDLPQAIQLAHEPEQEAAADGQTEDPADDEPGDRAAGVGAPAGDTRGAAVAPAPPTTPTLEEDPIGTLAEAAGYSDRELWWEHQVEQRLDATGLFEGILEAMSALRGEAAPPRESEARREAHMRQTIRAAQREGFERIAVVCGAWHAPVLTNLDDVAGDAAILAKLPRVEVAATWIPWTNSRLAYRTGYGAGIASPGWYAHLWASPDRTAIRWVAQVARALRAEDIDASSASVIETVRLADALAAMRDLTMPGLRELNEATLTVLCHGEDAPMRLIRQRLEIGADVGEVPPETLAVPLQRDLEAQRRRLKLTDRDLERMRVARKLAPSIPLVLDLDLRNDTDRARSLLIHRLRLLSIPWGVPQRESAGNLGTFHELWKLDWQPEFAIKLIECSVWGNTVAAAAADYASHLADETGELPQLTALLDRATLADLPDAVEYLLERIQLVAAVSTDLRHLMDALPPLARVARYGDVRGSHEERIARVMPIVDGLFERVLVGLPGGCASLDDDAAQHMVASLEHVQASLDLLDRADQRAAWHGMLRVLLGREAIHGLVRGRCCRLLLDKGAMDDAELQRLARLALSPATPAPQAAAWVQGLLHGSGLLLLHQDGLWAALDTWLTDLAPDVFVALLPLLRRAFSSFSAPERRAMGEQVKHLHQAGAAGSTAAGPAAEDALAELNREQADGVLPMLAHLLGVRYDSHG